MASPLTPGSEDLGVYEETAERIRALNERLIDGSTAAGRITLDAYEKTLSSFLEFEEHVAGATQLEWVSALAQVHATYLREVTSAYLTIARSLLG